MGEKEVTLYVPEGTYSRYASKKCWSRFKIISGDYRAYINGINYRLNRSQKTAEVIASDDNDITYSGDIVIPNKVEYNNDTFTVCKIGNRAFGGDGFKNGIFYYCKINSVIIPKTVKIIGVEAFAYTLLKQVIFEEGSQLTEIQERVFFGTESLSEISLPEGLKKIGSYAFQGCNLNSITIPESVEEMGSLIYHLNSNILKDIVVKWKYPRIFPNIFVNMENASRIRLHVPDGSKGFYEDSEPWCNFNIVEGKFSLIKYDFNGIRYTLQKPEMIASVIPCGEGMEPYSGNIILPNIIEYNDDIYCLDEVGTKSFCWSNIESISISSNVKSIGYRAFENSQLTELKFEEGSKLKNIKGLAFSGCNGLKYLSLPEGITTIVEASFYNCMALEMIDIPSSILSIEENAFAMSSALNSRNLKHVFVHWNEPLTVDENIFGYQLANEKITLHVPAGTAEKYKTVKPWSWFYEIVEDSVSKVENNFDYERQDQEEIIYDLNGIRIKYPKKGIYIVNGKLQFLK